MRSRLPYATRPPPRHGMSARSRRGRTRGPRRTAAGRRPRDAVRLRRTRHRGEPGRGPAGAGPSPAASGPGAGTGVGSPPLGAACRPMAPARRLRLASVSSAKSHSKGSTPVSLASACQSAKRTAAVRAGSVRRSASPPSSTSSGVSCEASASVRSLRRMARSGVAGSQPTMASRARPAWRMSRTRSRSAAASTLPRSSRRSERSRQAARPHGPLQPDDVRTRPAVGGRVRRRRGRAAWKRCRGRSGPGDHGNRGLPTQRAPVCEHRMPQRTDRHREQQVHRHAGGQEEEPGPARRERRGVVGGAVGRRGDRRQLVAADEWSQRRRRELDDRLAEARRNPRALPLPAEVERDADCDDPDRGDGHDRIRRPERPAPRRRQMPAAAGREHAPDAAGGRRREILGPRVEIPGPRVPSRGAHQSGGDEAAEDRRRPATEHQQGEAPQQQQQPWPAGNHQQRQRGVHTALRRDGAARRSSSSRRPRPARPAPSARPPRPAGPGRPASGPARSPRPRRPARRLPQPRARPERASRGRRGCRGRRVESRCRSTCREGWSGWETGSGCLTSMVRDRSCVHQLGRDSGCRIPFVSGPTLRASESSATA